MKRYVVALFQVETTNYRDVEDSDGGAQELVTAMLKGDADPIEPTYLYVGTTEPHVCSADGQPLTTGTD